jgi:hypothetical protein
VARLFESLQQLETRRTELCLHGLMQTMQAAAESREHELFQELAEVHDENQALRDEMEDLKRELEAFQQRPDTAPSSLAGGLGVAPVVLQRQPSVVKAQRNTGGRRRSSVLTGNTNVPNFGTPRRGVAGALGHGIPAPKLHRGASRSLLMSGLSRQSSVDMRCAPRYALLQRAHPPRTCARTHARAHTRASGCSVGLIRRSCEACAEKEGTGRTY